MPTSLAVRTRLLPIAVAAAAVPVAVAPSVATAATKVPVTGQQTVVTPDAGLATALTGLGATIRVTGGGSTDASGSFVFPVTGGSLTPELAGTVSHSGGIELKSKAGLKFGIKSFVIDTRSTPQLTAIPTLAGYSLGIRVPVATLDGLKATPGEGSTTVAATVTLNDIGALYLNLGLGKSVLKKGSVFGTAVATITTGS